MNTNKSYFYQSFAIVVISVAALIGFKQVLPEKLFSETTAPKQNVVVDSLMLEAVQEAAQNNNAEGSPGTAADTPKQPQKVVYKPSAATQGIVFPPENFSDYKGFQYLLPFFEKLAALEQTGDGSVRIAYFGDSMTDGDLIVKDLREAFQARFGGEGVGFVNITSESAASRSTLSHEFSKNWKTQSYLNVKKPQRPFGVSGYVFFAKHDTLNPAWVRYKAYNYQHTDRLNSPTLYYGQSGNTEARVRFITGKDTIIKKLNPANRLNTLKLGETVKSFKAEFIAADSIPVYGFNFDDGVGVHVDNFSNRGNSGLPISTLNTPLMKAFHEKLGYNLVILHYGTNVLNYGTYDYGWYENRMATVIKHLKECFPDTAILVISTADKSTKYGTQMKTDSAVVPLAQAQKRYALKNEAGYVNLYTLMGGEGSMVKWADTIPALANKDYTHFNHRGAKKVADLIYKQLSSGYEKYKKLGGNKVKANTTAKDSVKKHLLPKDTVRKNTLVHQKKNDTIHAKTD